MVCKKHRYRNRWKRRSVSITYKKKNISVNNVCKLNIKTRHYRKYSINSKDRDIRKIVYKIKNKIVVK